MLRLRVGVVGQAVLERLSEMMFVDTARRYLDSLPEDATGWLAGLRDRYVGRALGLLHERPEHPWTIDELGRDAAVSSTTARRWLSVLEASAQFQRVAPYARSRTKRRSPP